MVEHQRVPLILYLLASDVICSVGEDGKALQWSLSKQGAEVMAPYKEYKSKDKESINCLDWSNKTPGVMAMVSG